MPTHREPLVAKRHPRTPDSVANRADKLSKADWIDLYWDLYRQVFGEGESDAQIIADAERRRRIIEPLIREQRSELRRRKAESLRALRERETGR